MMYNMKSNFYPSAEQKNGHIGYADITVADAIRLNGISVFVKDDGNLNLAFPSFEGKDGTQHSYVIPANKDAYADMVQVVTDAVADQDHHFGHATGKYGPYLSVKGHLVDEPYADARFSVEVENFCTLTGISTRVAQLKEQDGSFIAVDLPTQRPYENKEGELVYPPAFEGLVSKYETQDHEKKSKDYGTLMRNLILTERKNLLERKPELNNVIAAAEKSSQQQKGGKTNYLVKENPVAEAVR